MSQAALGLQAQHRRVRKRLPGIKTSIVSLTILALKVILLNMSWTLLVPSSKVKVKLVDYAHDTDLACQDGNNISQQNLSFQSAWYAQSHIQYADFRPYFMNSSLLCFGCIGYALDVMQAEIVDYLPGLDCVKSCTGDWKSSFAGSIPSTSRK